MVDFVEEVEEQLRSDRYRSFARRAWPWFLAALVAVVVGWLAAWGYNSWRDRNIGQASITYDKAITDLAQGDQTGAFSTLDEVGKTGPAGYRTLALLGQGNMRLAARKTAEAVNLFDAAAKAAPNAILGDLARLRAVQALLDSAPYAEIAPRLQALIGEKKPFGLQAREVLAMAKLEAGQTAAAKADFTALSITLGVTQSMRARAQAAIGLIDSGQSAALLQVAKAAATLPPPVAPTVGPQNAGDAAASGGGPPPSAPQQGAGGNADGNGQ